MTGPSGASLRPVDRPEWHAAHGGPSPQEELPKLPGPVLGLRVRPISVIADSDSWTELWSTEALVAGER